MQDAQYMVITIDGPAGAGKSSVARRLAQRLGFRFLDTGAMYRAVALAALERQLPWSDVHALAQLVEQIDLQISEDAVRLDGRDVTQAIRSPAVTSAVHHVADPPAVRERLVEWQRRLAAGANFVTEGRDQGTVAFPDAACKVFLTAAADERARRRMLERQQQGLTTLSQAQVLAEQNERDRRDRDREVGQLAAAPDAHIVATDGKTLDEVVAEIEQLVLSGGSPAG